MKRVTASLILLLIASPIVAQEPVQEREHVVRRGDTLWDIAGYYFNDPFRWPRIYEANTAVVENPHWIYPEEVLVIPGLEGQARAVAPAPRAATQVAVVRPDRPVRTVFFREPPASEVQGDPTVLSEPVDERVPVRKGTFNSAPFVTHPSDLDVVGGFIRTLRENRDVGGAPSAHPQDAVFLGYGSGARPEVGQNVLLVHVGDGVAGVGGGQRIIQPTGIVRILRHDPDVMLGRIETQYERVHRGDVAIPMPLYPEFAVEEAERVSGGHDLEGRILEFMLDHPLPGRADIAFVNLGILDGVRVGDLFTAFLPERAARSREGSEFRTYIERLPPERIGTLRVIRVTDDVATVLVEQLSLPRLQPGIGVRRTHRIP